MLSRNRKYSALSPSGSKYGCKCKYSAIKFGSAASQKTQEYAQTVNDSVIKPTKEKYQEGTLFTELSAGTKSLATKLSYGYQREDSEQTPIAEGTQQSMDGFTAIWSDEPTPLDKSEGSSLMGDSSNDKSSQEKDRLRSPDENWGWGDDDTWGDSKSASTTKKSSSSSTTKKTDEDDGWAAWGNDDEQGDLLLDFGDNPKPSKSKPSKPKKSSSSNNSSKPIKSLEDDWNEDGGWDDAAWDAVEQEVQSKPLGKKGD